MSPITAKDLSLMQPEQWLRIQSILKYSATNVPYFRSLFNRLGLTLSDLNEPSTFFQIPCVSKQVIQQQWDDFLSDEYRDTYLIAHYTSGSTGMPLKVVQTPLERLAAGRHMMRARMKWGLSFPARWTILGGAIHFVSGIEEQVRKGRQGGTDVLRLSCLDLCPATLEKYLTELEQFQPTWIYSLPSTLDLMARFILERGYSFKLPTVRLIELAGEYLSPEARLRIKEAFGYTPANQYSCREIWGIAFECPMGGMHVLDKHVYLEILDQANMPVSKGEVGEVVITGLNCRAMPFIRYRLGDLAMWEEKSCPCNDPRPLIHMVGGRTGDYIAGQPEKVGNIIFDSLFNYLQREGISALKRFQIVQRSFTDFDVSLVTEQGWSDQAMIIFENRAKSILGNDVQFHFRIVEEIPTSPSGKMRSFRVELDSDVGDNRP